MQIGKTANAKIPIVSDARLHQTSRGFLPWRFAYAGPGVRRPTVMGPPSANLHSRVGSALSPTFPVCTQLRTGCCAAIIEAMCQKPACALTINFLNAELTEAG